VVIYLLVACEWERLEHASAWQRFGVVLSLFRYEVKCSCLIYIDEAEDKRAQGDDVA
jgi:hypothetical protein